MITPDWYAQLATYRGSQRCFALCNGVAVSEGARYFMQAARARWLLQTIADQLHNACDVHHVEMRVGFHANYTCAMLFNPDGGLLHGVIIKQLTLPIQRLVLHAERTTCGWLMMLAGERSDQ